MIAGTLRFLVGAIFMVVVNLIPLGLTWKAYRTDGFECIGWPFHFLERGIYASDFRPHWFAIDVATSLLVAIGFAFATRRRLTETIHRLRTWGTPWDTTSAAEMTSPAPMQFSLRTLLILLLVVPPLVGAGWAVWHFMLRHVVTIERFDP